MNVRRTGRSHFRPTTAQSADGAKTKGGLDRPHLRDEGTPSGKAPGRSSLTVGREALEELIARGIGDDRVLSAVSELRYVPIYVWERAGGVSRALDGTDQERIAHLAAVAMATRSAVDWKRPSVLAMPAIERLTAMFGVTRAAAVEWLEARRTAAREALAEIRDAAQEALWAELDPDALVDELADPLTDGTLHMGDPRPAITRKAALIGDRLETEKLRRRGESLRAEAIADPDLSELGRWLERRSTRSPAMRAVLGMIAESFGSYADLKANVLADPAAFLEEIDGCFEECRRAEAAIEQIDRELRAEQKDLASGRLSLSRGTRAAIERWAKDAYPKECIGYIASDGGRTYFFPIGTAYASGGGAMERYEDVVRMNRLCAGLGLHLIAKVHSHVEEAPEISRADAERIARVVAHTPGLRTLIASVRRVGGARKIELASFRTDESGAVVGRDRVGTRR
jgi:hypothetical protein